MGLLRTLLASVAKRRNPVEFLNCPRCHLHVRRDEIGPPFVTRTRWIQRLSAGIAIDEVGFRGTAAILSRPCPLWVKSGHSLSSDQCPLYLQKRTSEPTRGMS